MIDWLTLNANVSNISWREQILYNKLINYKTLRNKTFVYKTIGLFLQRKEILRGYKHILKYMLSIYICVS
jgi:hypothetical protein